jgi:hypothetical protein
VGVIDAPATPAAAVPILVPEGTRGLLNASRPVPVVFSTPRLHGRFGPGWTVEDVTVWGAGAVGAITVWGAGVPDRVSAWPNRAEIGCWDGWIAFGALPDLPVVVLDLQLATASVTVQLRPATVPGRLRAGAPLPPPADPVWRAGDRTLTAVLPWGALAVTGADVTNVGGNFVETPGHSCLLLAAGADEAEVQQALARARERSFEELIAAASGYRAWCGSRLETDDPILGSLMSHSIHAAVASRKETANGRFGGLSAGIGYAYPARTYYRDGFWTCQSLLAFSPEIVREEILVLAAGVHEDGEAPSGTIVGVDGEAAGESWSDHFDSPLFLPILVDQYVARTGDRDVVSDRAGFRTVGATLRQIGGRYLTMAGKGAGLPLKPRHDRDWADNVFRAGAVAYDSMLYLAALRSLEKLVGGRSAPRYKAALAAGEAALERELWLPDRGYYADFRDADGFVEDHLALDTVIGVWLGVLPEERSSAVLEAIRTKLFTAADDSQPYGDWGLRSCRPPYRRASDVRAKSAFAYRYHNGSDWPYLDAIDAACRLRSDPPLPGWEYSLLRWWKVGLALGWSDPVEYYSPPYGRGALLQAWSGMAAAAIAEAFGWSPFGATVPRPSPWPGAHLRGF